jgi:hypothetical protein
LRSDVVTLWQGGTYQLYRYKRYTDVRIVFAPEQQAAFFGGDPDNFEFPRFDFDICLLRAYENGVPAKTKDFLKFSPTGPRAGELVFVSGHPGGTSRLLTLAELNNLRSSNARKSCWETGANAARKMRDARRNISSVCKIPAKRWTVALPVCLTRN